MSPRIPRPGTQAYERQLAREAHVIKSDMKGLREVARIRAATSGRPVAGELAVLMMSEAGIRTQQDAEEYNARVLAHRAALVREDQVDVNQREAVKIQEASCGRCFLVHAGDCY